MLQDNIMRALSLTAGVGPRLALAATLVGLIWLLVLWAISA
jgi:hypothetical protein